MHKIKGSGDGIGRDSGMDDERSQLEIIEEEVKSSTFGVFYLLLKNNESSFWKISFILMIEYF